MDILNRLNELKDADYQKFHAKLVPNISSDSIIGVRIPILKRLAKELYSDPCKDDFMNEIPHRYYEENQLHIMMICMEKDFDKCIKELNAFLPYADNWAVTDQPSPKCFKKKHTELVPVIIKWLESDHVYTSRYAINIFMRELLDEDYKPHYSDLISIKRGDDYYLNMMRAWYFATALAKRYDDVIHYLENNELDKWTHNKTIQKACESFRVTEEHKKYLKTLKIK